MSLIFVIIFEKTLDIREMTVHSLLECLLCVTYINSVTQGVLFTVTEA